MSEIETVCSDVTNQFAFVLPCFDFDHSRFRLLLERAQLLMYAGGEHQLRKHLDPLIDQLVSALALAYPVAQDFALSLTLRFLTGDHLALGVLLCVRLGTICCLCFRHLVFHELGAVLTSVIAITLSHLIARARAGNAVDRCMFTRADMYAARRMCDFGKSVFLFSHFVQLNQTITARVISEIRRAYEAPANKNKKLSWAAVKRIVAMQRYVFSFRFCSMA